MFFHFFMISACVLDLPLFTGPGWRKLRVEGGAGGTDGVQAEGEKIVQEVDRVRGRMEDLWKARGGAGT